MENNKTQAEIYREERKERLAKAAAKQAKKSPKLSKSKKIAGKVIAILLAVVVALGAVGGVLSFFGVPQKVLKVSIGDSDYSFSVAEFNYYYYNTWYNYHSTAYQYESYYGEGMGASLTGYDYTKAPTEQEYTDDMVAMTGLTLEDLGNPENPTWSDAFTYAAISNILQVKFGAQKAKEAGITLTEAQESEIENYIKDARDTAKSNDYSLDRWLHSQIGKGLSEDLVYEIQTNAYLATAYYEKLEKDTTNAITSDEINAEYNKNPDFYDIFSARIYTMSAVEVKVKDDATAEEKKAAEEKSATETKAKVTTGATGVSTGQKESELNLKVSLLLKEELTKKGYTVIMTRTINDVNMSNSERAKIANNANADAFIRIHANSASSSSAKGVLTMCQTEKNIYNGHLAQDSYNLSKLVVDNIVKKTGANNRSVTKTDTMSGINWCTVPTTIVEMGFLSNPEEDKLMATQEYQKKIVDGIVQGIEEYFESK